MNLPVGVMVSMLVWSAVDCELIPGYVKLTKLVLKHDALTRTIIALLQAKESFFGEKRFVQAPLGWNVREY
jgi:hypothetical protein